MKTGDSRQRVQKCGTRLAFGVFFWMLVSSSVGAIPPEHVPDEKLAKSAVIVVGRWNKAPIRVHARAMEDRAVAKDEKVITTYEAHTELVVEKVIKGDIKPGTQKILLGPDIGWPRKDGGPVMSFTSTECVGDVEEVTHSNLWFLQQVRSWDKADPKTYLGLETYRGVQQVVLQPYFLALASGNANEEVPKLLSVREPLVLQRVLAYVSGGELPWPFEPDWFARFMGIERRWQPLTKYAADVERLLDRKEPTVRREAAAVYAELAGKAAAPRLRRLLTDSEADVRAVAAGNLIRLNDRASVAGICNAVGGVQGAHLACQVIEQLRLWKNVESVPALIVFLQNDAVAYQKGDDVGMPALKAQVALKELTGADFPCDVELSRKAWAKAKTIDDEQKRSAFLTELLDYEPRPFAATLVNDENGKALVLTNRSKRAVALAKKPTYIDYEWPKGIGTKSGHLDPVTKTGFTTVTPGGIFRIPLDKDYAQQPLSRISVYYLQNGHETGLNAWLGRVVLSLDGR